MEELLNKLIEKGWKPRGENVELYGVSKNTFGERIVIFIGNAGGFKKWGCTYRELVSKESGLWQFVCENRMTKKMEKIPRGIWINSWHKSAYEKCPVYTMEKAEYRIIESALCNEEDLENFLLKNIQLGKLK